MQKNSISLIILVMVMSFLFVSCKKDSCIICSYSSDIDNTVLKTADGCGTNREKAEAKAIKALGDQPQNSTILCY